MWLSICHNAGGQLHSQKLHQGVPSVEIKVKELVLVKFPSNTGQEGYEPRFYLTAWKYSWVHCIIAGISFIVNA